MWILELFGGIYLAVDIYSIQFRIQQNLLMSYTNLFVINKKTKDFTERKIALSEYK